MKILKSLKELENKHAFTFLSTVLAVVFGAITFHSEFLSDKNPELVLEIQADTSVLDVREQLSNLSILFNGEDIRKQGKSLRVVTLRISNPSEIDILQSSYDTSVPFGINVSGGEVIRAEIIDASNPYLRKHMKIASQNEDAVMLSTSIIESGQTATLKLLILHNDSENPTVSFAGKIAGIQAVPVIEIYKEEADENWITKAFSGSWLVQGVRALSYTVLLMFGLGFLVILLGASITFFEKRDRKKAARAFREKTDLVLTSNDETLLSVYVSSGFVPLNRCAKVIKAPEKWSELYLRFKEKISPAWAGAKTLDAIETARELRRGYSAKDCNPGDIGIALKLGVLEDLDGRLELNVRAEKTFESFYNFLSNRGEHEDVEHLDLLDELSALTDDLDDKNEDSHEQALSDKRPKEKDC